MARRAGFRWGVPPARSAGASLAVRGLFWQCGGSSGSAGGFSRTRVPRIVESMKAWNDWYHASGHTYGTWLPGDPRGWRSKGHKRHVEGDYKTPPPPGTDAGILRHSRESLRTTPVHLDRSERCLVGQAMVDMLFEQGVELLTLCQAAVHFHVLGRFRGSDVRPRVGRAKKHATFVLRDRGRDGRLWGRKCKIVPITERQHQLNVFNYIVRHVNEGAWVWTFRDGVSWATTIRKKPR